MPVKVKRVLILRHCTESKNKSGSYVVKAMRSADEGGEENERDEFLSFL